MVKVNVKAAVGQGVMFNKDKVWCQRVVVNEAVFTDCFLRKKKKIEHDED